MTQEILEHETSSSYLEAEKVCSSRSGVYANSLFVDHEQRVALRHIDFQSSSARAIVGAVLLATERGVSISVIANKEDETAARELDVLIANLVGTISASRFICIKTALLSYVDSSSTSRHNPELMYNQIINDAE